MDSRPQEPIRDMTIIGAGPAGLFAAFQAGMHEASCRILESLPQVGGQLAALYPEKAIFDVPGFPKILARDLVARLLEQTQAFPVEIRLQETAQELRTLPDGTLEVVTNRARYPTRAVILATGLGAFRPRKLPFPELERWEGTQVFYAIREKERFRGKRVLIVGGGDSALDWVVNLQDVAREVVLIHRREQFRAHPHTVQEVQRLAREGRVSLWTPYEIQGILASGDRFQGLILKGPRGEEKVEGDFLVPQIG